MLWQRIKVGAALTCVYLPGALTAWAQPAAIENCSRSTACAESDNIDIPIYATNASSLRIIARNPRYYPTSIEIWEPDFTDCPFTTRDIWWIGDIDGSSAEFRSSGMTNGDVYFAPDDPPEGVDEPWSNFPHQINNDWLYDQYIRFSANQEGDFNHELVIGARLTIRMADISGTLELSARVWSTNGWIDLGSRVFHTGSMLHAWEIPDHTWLPGTDSNVIWLHVVRAGEGSNTTTNAWACYDYLHLRKRDELGDNSLNPTVLFTNSDIRVETVWIDFWWRDPRAMTVEVIGGGSDTNVQYLRIKQRMPNSSDWNEIFVLYEDGNARIIPFPPEGLGAVPYGASVILGPTTNASRPACGIDRVVVDPEDLSLDIFYEGGGSARVELRCDRDAHVVDLSQISYDTTNFAVARLRSMWVRDGKADVDRVRGTEGFYPILEGWTNFYGEWWEFYRDVPSYHNTYCPEFRFELCDVGAGYLVREAESLDAGSGYEVVSGRTNASGGQSIYLSTNGGTAVYDVVLASNQPDSWIIIRYADADGGNGIDVLGNTITVVVDGVVTAESYTVDTGGWGQYELLPSLYLGSLSSGTHQITITAGAGTEGVELDRFLLINRPARTRIARSILTRQAEDYDSQSNATFCFRNDVQTMHLEHTEGGGSLGFSLSVTDSWSNVYLRVRYSDDVGPNRIEIYLDGELRALFPSETTSEGFVDWTIFTNSPPIYIGSLMAGSHWLQINSDTNTWGVDIDEFELYSLYDNRSPRLLVPEEPVVLAVGAYTGIVVLGQDDDGDSVAVSNITAPAGATFSGGVFSWTASAADEKTTNPVVFVADDLRGLSNSVVTNGFLIVVPLDWDGDGLPDGWEWNQFATLTNTADGDRDGDGADNYHEYLAGTMPTNPASVFAADWRPGTNDTEYLIWVPTAYGRHYTIYFTDWLGSGSVWSTFADTNIGIGTWLETNQSPAGHTFVDDCGPRTSGGPPANGRRFYRVRVRKEQ